MAAAEKPAGSNTLDPRSDNRDRPLWWSVGRLDSYCLPFFLLFLRERVARCAVGVWVAMSSLLLAMSGKRKPQSTIRHAPVPVVTLFGVSERLAAR